MIDYDKPIDEENEIYEIYFLNMVDDRDLLSGLSDEEITATPTPQIIYVTPEPTIVPSVNAEPAPQQEKPVLDGQAGLLLLLILMVGGGGAAYWFLKKKKDSTTKSRVMDESGFEDEDEEEENNMEDSEHGRYDIVAYNRASCILVVARHCGARSATFDERRDSDGIPCS